MWKCPKCGEQHDDQFDACWKCSPALQEPTGPALGSARVLDCLRCATRLEYAGKKKFHEGSNWGVIGELGELFVKRETLHFYFCPKCGKVEFYVD